MSEWKLFGDVSTLDEGGILVRKEYDEEEYDFQKTTYQVIQIMPHPDDEKKCLAGIASIDVSDYRKNEELMESFKSYFGEEEFTDEELAYSVMDYYNMAELSSLSFNGKRAEYSCSIMEYDVNKWDLAKSLKEDYGYENDNINEWADKKVSKIVGFEYDEEALKLASIDTILVDSDTFVAALDIEIDGEKKKVEEYVTGEVKVTYKDDVFYKASDFPKELIELIKQDPNETVIYEDGKEEPIYYVDSNNWVSEVYDNENNGDIVVDCEATPEKEYDAMVESLTSCWGIDFVENADEFKKEFFKNKEKEIEKE